MAVLTKEVMLKILASDGDAQAKIDAIARKAEELKEENPDLAVRIDTAAASAKLGVLRDELKDAAASTDELSGALDEYNAAAMKAQETAARLAEVQADDAASTEDLTAALDANAAASLRSLDAQMRLVEVERQSAVAAAEAGDAQVKAGEKGEEGSGLMEGAWGKAKLALLGVGAAMVYGMVKAAGFQQVMTRLSTQAGVAKSQLGSLSSGVLSLAGQVGFAPDSLGEALYHIESSFASVGITGPKALMLLKTAAEGADVGGSDLVDTTNALDAVIASGVGGVKNYSQAMGALNATVGAGDMTMQDLADAMGTGVMAVAKSFGQTIQQVGAALAVFGDNNIRGAKAGTDLRMAWQAVQAPLKTGIPILNQLGLSATTLANTMEHHGMSAAVGQFIDHLKASKVPMSQWGQLVTEIFGKKAGVGIGILIDQFSRLQSKFPDLEKGANKFGSAWAQQQKTVSQEWKDLETGAEALATKLGAMLLPTAMKVVHVVTEFVNALEEGKGPAMVIAGIIGTTLAGIALKKLEDGLTGAVEGFQGLIRGGQALASGVGSLIAKLTGATAAQEAQTAATEEGAVAQGELDAAMDANPIGLIILAVAALIAVIVLVVTHLKFFERIGMDAFNGVAHAAEAAFNWLKDHWKMIAVILGGPFGVAAVLIAGHFKQIKNAADDAFRFVAHVAEVAIDWIRAHWPLLIAILAGPFGIAVDLITGHYHMMVSGAQNAIHAVTSWFERLPGMILGAVASFGSLLFNAGASLLEGLLHGIESMVGGVIGAVEHVGSSILGGIEGALGIGSPSKEMRIRGQYAVQGLVLGLNDGLPAVSQASMRLARAISSGYAAGGHGATPGGGSGQLVIEIHPPAGAAALGPEFMTALANGIRVRGGDPRILTRKVVLA